MKIHINKENDSLRSNESDILLKADSVIPSDSHNKDSREKNIKFIKKYILILFVAVLVLLIISAITQYKTMQEKISIENSLQETNKNFVESKSNLLNVQEENAQLKEDLKKVQQIVDASVETMQEFNNQIELSDKKIEIIGQLSAVQQLYITNQRTKAKEAFLKIEKTSVPISFYETYNYFAKIYKVPMLQV